MRWKDCKVGTYVLDTIHNDIGKITCKSTWGMAIKWIGANEVYFSRIEDYPFIRNNFKEITLDEVMVALL